MSQAGYKQVYVTISESYLWNEIINFSDTLFTHKLQIIFSIVKKRRENLKMRWRTHNWFYYNHSVPKHTKPNVLEWETKFLLIRFNQYEFQKREKKMVPFLWIRFPSFFRFLCEKNSLKTGNTKALNSKRSALLTLFRQILSKNLLPF